MANKRQLKKRIQYVCGDMAADLLQAYYLCDNIKDEDVNKLLNEIAFLQDSATAKASFFFDKVKKDFANPADYNKAHEAYNKKAFGTLREDFAAKANEIVKQMNGLVPADVRKAVSE